MAIELPELAPYDFALPQDAIAQEPLPERDAARLFVLDRAATPGADRHMQVRELDSLLGAGDLLVLNRTRVVAARLRGCKASGGRAEALILGPVAARPGRYRALLKTGGRLRRGLELRFSAPRASDAPRTLDARVDLVHESGSVELAFAPGVCPYEIGEPPLPPYIQRGVDDPERVAFDRERYQTVFADEPGAIAAPTAGLHLTREVLERLAAAGVEIASLVLHVGLGTFRPLRDEDLANGRLHRERYHVPVETADAIARTRARKGRVVAVGTTTTRALETCARQRGHGARSALEPGSGTTQLFLRPGDRFRVVDGLLTNFHLPRSSLLMLVCAFAGRTRVMDAYAEAVRRGYRFYSYGDAMLIL